MASNAVSSNWVSAVLGYMLAKGNFSPTSPNLPQNISILGEANHANQSGLSTDPTVILSAKQAGDLYGYGSPIHAVARILFPSTGTGVTVPVTVFAQAEDGSPVAKVITITPTGTATGNGTIKIKIAGRTQVDGGSYAIDIETGDTPTNTCDKIRAAIAGVLGCPMTGSGTSTAILTAKWKGLTSNDLNVVIDTTGTDTGVTFGVVNTTAGSGSPTVTDSLTAMGNAWNTMVINTYGLNTDIMDELEAYNGVPDPTNPTGQYGGLIWRPMWAFSGTVADDPTSITNARPDQVTIVPCPAPLSLGMPYEAAANYVAAIVSTFQNNPEADIIGVTLPDMPSAPAGSNPQMNGLAFRQYCVTHGCSTAEYVNGATGNGKYKIVDLLTTYNLEGEYPPYYRYVRDLNVHWNYKFGYHLLELQKLFGKTLIANSSTATSSTCIKPRMWSADVAAYNLDCEKRGLIVNAATNNKTIEVDINGTNPNRLDTTQQIQISGIVRINATTVTGGFNFTN